MPRVIRTPRAELDLIDIWHYIATNSTPERADNINADIEKRLDLLASNPLLGRSREELRPNPRSFPAGTHSVFYHPLDDGIEVVRVLDGRRDIPAIFEDEN